MMNTYDYSYTYDRVLSDVEWGRLREFCRLIAAKSDNAAFHCGPLTPSFAILEDIMSPASGVELDNDHFVRFACAGRVRRTTLGATAVAVLMAAQHSGRLLHWHSWPAGVEETNVRRGAELYYSMCDTYVKDHGYAWWQRRPAAETATAAAAFHVRWKAVEGDVALMATAAEALTALSSARGGCPLLHLLEELNEILIEHFDLDRRHFLEDLESVDDHGMLEKWRDEMFEIVVHGRI